MTTVDPRLQAPGRPLAAQRMDPVTLEVLRHGLEEIAEEMNLALMLAAYSTNITDRRDSSCAVFLPRGEPVAQSESGTPLHLGVMPTVVKAVLERVPLSDMKPGDQFVTNIPYPEGPGHLNDVTVVLPVFYREEPVALVANQAHHIDVGGMVPGSMPATSTEIFQEGLQIPVVRLLAGGCLRDDILSLFLANVRTPEVSRGDLMAQVAANNVGEMRFRSLSDRFGLETVLVAMEELLDHGERRMRSLINEIPQGVYCAEDTLEGPDGTITLRVALHVNESEIVADFTGTDRQVAAPLNCRPSTVRACLGYVASALLDPGQTPNAGVFRALKVVTPEGSLVSAHYPASLVHSNIVTTQRICDVLLRAFGRAFPARAVAASSGTQMLVCIGGTLATSEPFVYVETHGGGSGAMQGADGESGVHTYMTNTLNSPVEVLEQTFPFRVAELALEPNSAGEGQWRGGCGVRKSIVVDAPCTLTVATDRTKTTPWGVCGGGEATSSQLTLRKADEVKDLPGRGTFYLEAGDTFTLVTPGGGGYGDRALRDFDAVEHDRRDGLVS